MPSPHAAFQEEVRVRWDVDALNNAVRASQQRRLLVQQVGHRTRAARGMHRWVASERDDVAVLNPPGHTRAARSAVTEPTVAANGPPDTVGVSAPDRSSASGLDREPRAGGALCSPADEAGPLFAAARPGSLSAAVCA